LAAVPTDRQHARRQFQHRLDDRIDGIEQEDGAEIEAAARKNMV